ncbi:MAG: prepilin peptidase [Lacipirellulaceae bacterium]
MHGWFEGWFDGFEKSPYLLERGPWIAVVLWLAAVGGSIGSFLNVVALRRPAGEDIVHQGSRCPVCRHPIRWRHNLPLLGWPLLRGRCYDCRTPIPIRYWLWELGFATLLVAAGIATPWL